MINFINQITFFLTEASISVFCWGAWTFLISSPGIKPFHHCFVANRLAPPASGTQSHTVLPMNSGAEAVESAIKAVRKWGYQVKKVAQDRAEIIVCENNFHGRTLTIVGFSTEEQYREGYAPFTPGFKIIPFGDAEARRFQPQNMT